MNEGNGIHHSQVKEKNRNLYIRHVLNSKNRVTVVSTLNIPLWLVTSTLIIANIKKFKTIDAKISKQLMQWKTSP